MKHLCRQHLLHDVQLVFVTKRSFLTNLLRVLNMANQLMNYGDDVDICFLDTALEISLQVVGSVRSFLSYHSFYILIDDVIYEGAAVPVAFTWAL